MSVVMGMISFMIFWLLGRPFKPAKQVAWEHEQRPSTWGDRVLNSISCGESMWLVPTYQWVRRSLIQHSRPWLRPTRRYSLPLQPVRRHLPHEKAPAELEKLSFEGVKPVAVNNGTSTSVKGNSANSYVNAHGYKHVDPADGGYSNVGEHYETVDSTDPADGGYSNVGELYETVDSTATFVPGATAQERPRYVGHDYQYMTAERYPFFRYARLVCQSFRYMPAKVFRVLAYHMKLLGWVKAHWQSEWIGALSQKHRGEQQGNFPAKIATKAALKTTWGYIPSVMVAVPEVGYGASRSRSHSSSSERRMGLWLQQGWDPDYDPLLEPPRRRAPPPPETPLTRRQRRREERQRRRRAQRPRSPSIPLEHLEGPPVSWEEFAEDDPRDRRSPDSRDFERDRPAGPMLEQDEQGRWILLLRWASPRGMLVHLRLTQQFPITPLQVEQMLRQQFPGLTEGLRIGVASWRTSGAQELLRPDRPFLDHPDPHRAPFVLVPERGYGAAEASNDLQEAFRLVRQHPQLALLSDAKSLRTMLAAQPRVASKVVRAVSNGERYDLVIAGFKRSGLAPLLHASVPRPGGKTSSGSMSGPRNETSRAPHTPQESVRDDSSKPPPNRWQRHIQVSAVRDGWQKVERTTRRDVTHKLIDEWSVRIVESLKLHQSGIMLVESYEEAKHLAIQLKDTAAPAALISRMRHDNLGAHVSVHRVGFHLSKQVPGREAVTIPVVGWLHQLSVLHKVGLQKAPQVYSQTSRGDTVVVRLMATSQWTPEATWQLLQKGKIHPLKEEAVKQLQSQAPGQVGALHDAFRLEMRGKAVSCSLQLATSALKPLLACSGRGWLFVHPIGDTVPKFPTIWNGLVHPDELGPAFQRSKDAGGLGLTLGERHLGYRVSAETESSVRQQLDTPTKVAWVLSGVPLAYSSCEANQILSDLGIVGHVAEHTRRVGRAGQNWLVYLGADDTVDDDVLQIEHEGRQYFVTFSPLKAKDSPNRVKVWQRAPKKSEGQKQRTWAEVVQPKQPAQPSHDPLHQRMQKMEQLIQSLVALLQAPGSPELPTPVRSLVQELSTCPAHVADVPSPSEIDSQAGEDEQDNWSDDEDMQFEEEPSQDSPAGKRKMQPRIREPDPKKAKEPSANLPVTWGTVPYAPFKHVMWGRVRGDGNCFWRAAGLMIGEPWSEVKTRAFAAQDAVQASWCELFHSTEIVWTGLMKSQQKDEYANEACCTLLAHVLARPVVIVGGGEMIYVTWTGSDPDWEKMLVFRLTGEHYSPMVQDVTILMVKGMKELQQIHIGPSLQGGGRRKLGDRVSSVCTWNVDSLQTKLHSALALPSSIILAQETGLTARGQQRAARVAEEHNWKLFPGEPVPLGMSRAKRLRAQKGAVPGVAFLARANLAAGPVDCLTTGGQWLRKRGRFAWLRVGLAVGYVLVGNIYMPTGDTAESCSDRLACHEALTQEVGAWRQIPILVGGDWNEVPAENATFGSLYLNGWRCPLVCRGGDLADSTFASGTGMVAGRLLDYWLCSPRFQAISQQQALEQDGPGHRPVRMDLEGFSSMPRSYVVPRAPDCDRSKKSPTCYRTDWQHISTSVVAQLEKHDVEAAWQIWNTAHHANLLDEQRMTSETPPGEVRWSFKQPKARLTKLGQEDALQIKGARLARRLYDYHMRGGCRVRHILGLTWAPITCALGLVIPLSEALEDPLASVSELRSHLAQRLERKKRQGLYSWKKGLVKQGHPSSKLFSWLKSERGVVAPTLQENGETLTDVGEILAAHRQYWEKLGTQW